MTNILHFDKSRGFTRMDNQMMEALAAVNLSPAEFKTLHAITRMTVGYQLQERRITAEEVAKKTNILPAHVSRAISNLLARRVLYRVGGSRGDIGICNPSEWVYEEQKAVKSTQPKSVEITKIGSVDQIAKLPISDDSLLYTKEIPLVTVPSEQITAPQGAEPTQPEIKIEDPEPLVSFDGEDFKVDDTLITKWAQAYAPIDIESEIKRAAAWASANRPKKDWRRFLVKWLGNQLKRNPNGASEAGVPVDKIIAMYHSTCPNLMRVSVEKDQALRSMIAERWTESTDHQVSSFWKSFFIKANNRNDVYFRGARVTPRLEALVSRAVFREIVESAQ